LTLVSTLVLTESSASARAIGESDFDRCDCWRTGTTTQIGVVAAAVSDRGIRTGEAGCDVTGESGS
jgi:hypothetical protein